MDKKKLSAEDLKKVLGGEPTSNYKTYLLAVDLPKDQVPENRTELEQELKRQIDEENGFQLIGLDNRVAQDIIVTKMHMILFPGEYGLGDEPESMPDATPEQIMQRLGQLLEELIGVNYNYDVVEEDIRQHTEKRITEIEQREMHKN